MLTPDDEVREAYYVFSHLVCDEQMWDFEGKEVDEHVVEKLLTAYDDYFTTNRLGEDVFLTPRIPNPSSSPHKRSSCSRSFTACPATRILRGSFYKCERPPVFELIYPMTTSARDLDRVRAYCERFVAGMKRVVLEMDESPLGNWFGRFTPATVRMIPLIEDREHLLAADDLVRSYVAGEELDHRPGVHRALDREIGSPIYPIIGVGSVPFRAGLSPATTDRCLRIYPSVQTVTIQSAFKYDHPLGEVREAVTAIHARRRARPLPIAADPRTSALLDRVTTRYQSEVDVSVHVPREGHGWST